MAAAKHKNRKRSSSRSASTTNGTGKRPFVPPPPPTPRDVANKAEENAKWWREAVEAVVVAVVLALLFRTFEAEAFVIPTGSMAPTLQGRHKDVVCPKCGADYQAGASLDHESMHGPVSETACPMCNYQLAINPRIPNQDSFSGDRILVNKFAYQFGSPHRWDVIVFKFPGNAKQNYIKRLVGLPGESLKIYHGDVFVRANDAADQSADFVIARKPPGKLATIMQPVYDTKFTSPELIQAGWPSRWRNDNSNPIEGGLADSDRWSVADDHHDFSLKNKAPQIAWLRYEHLEPSEEDWRRVESGQPLQEPGTRRGRLITDFYAYNAFEHPREGQLRALPRVRGWHWVGDLAVEADVQVNSPTGQLSIDLVEGGRHFTCHVDVSTGQAELQINNSEIPFVADGQADAPVLTANTKIRGKGRYQIRMANVDDQITLWVNNKAVPFQTSNGDHPATFETPDDVRPVTNETDAGDLRPVGIGGSKIELHVQWLRVLRDTYYVATSHPTQATEYTGFNPGQFERSFEFIARTLDSPDLWSSSPIFDQRRSVEFTLKARQYFPMGDNSPQSLDARLWHGQNPSTTPAGTVTVSASVQEELLIGKAFLVYWPHPWYAGTRLLPVVPNIGRMGRIR